MQPSILNAFGWRCALVLTKDWLQNPDDVLNRMEKLLQGQDVADAPTEPDDEPVPPVEPKKTASGAGAVSPQVISTGTRKSAPTPGIQPQSTPPPDSNPSSIRYFEFVGGLSKKFWEISVSGNSFTVRFGRIGTLGQSQTKTFSDEAKSGREAGHLVAEKLKKGYVERKAG